MSLHTKLAGLMACLRFDNKLQLIAARTIFRRTRFVSYRLNDVDFVSDTLGGDECGLRPCLVEGMYMPFLDAAGWTTSNVPLNVADIGANAGGFALIFAVHHVPVKKIVSVEMNPLTFARMQLNVLTAFGPRAKPVNAAVSDRSGMVDVAFTTGGTGEGLAANRPAGGPTFPVRVMTMDEYLDESFPGEVVDLMKLDIEGSEWDILDSGTCQRLRGVRFLIVEVHPHEGRTVKDFDERIAPFGFKRLPIENADEADVFCYENQLVGTPRQSSGSA